jgi:hypothetical protein
MEPHHEFVGSRIVDDLRTLADAVCVKRAFGIRCVWSEGGSEAFPRHQIAGTIDADSREGWICRRVAAAHVLSIPIPVVAVPQDGGGMGLDGIAIQIEKRLPRSEHGQLL